MAPDEMNPEAEKFAKNQIAKLSGTSQLWATRLLSFVKNYYPNGLATHLDCNKILSELSRSKKITTYNDHPSGKNFTKMAAEIVAWKKTADKWSKCGSFPKFGNLESLMVQKILMVGTTPSNKGNQAFHNLDIDFAFEEGAKPTDPFWFDSKFADQTWRDGRMKAQETGWANISFAVNMNILFRSDRIKKGEKKEQVETDEEETDQHTEKDGNKRTLAYMLGSDSDDESQPAKKPIEVEEEDNDDEDEDGEVAGIDGKPAVSKNSKRIRLRKLWKIVNTPVTLTPFEEDQKTELGIGDALTFLDRKIEVSNTTTKKTLKEIEIEHDKEVAHLRQEIKNVRTEVRDAKEELKNMVVVSRLTNKVMIKVIEEKLKMKKGTLKAEVADELDKEQAKKDKASKSD
ncbi:hypothetical protein B0T18DRAFT_49001 [Schizothecium vesticola]|uniref:Uncharacterized protein n=1 Tax=Schizothecium vesticola TaxID=314040 RepID=A0AA40FBV8_9PEZI|nr:hypothetical protein B0T18DRAFT_49001 [Schizothecium vesticola]